MVVFGSRKRWDRWHSPYPNWQLIYHLTPSGGLYATDPTFYGNQKQPLILGSYSPPACPLKRPAMKTSSFDLMEKRITRVIPDLPVPYILNQAPRQANISGNDRPLVPNI